MPPKPNRSLGALDTLIEESASCPAATGTRASSTAQLTVLAGPQLGRVYPLMQGVLTLGRATDAAIHLPLTSVSREHARIHWMPDGSYEVEDLGSRNGTKVDGEPLRGRRLLRSGDRIQLGSRALLQFSVVDQLDRRLHEAEKLEVVGRLSAAVNHDFNNLLTVLSCGLSYLLELGPSTALGASDVMECLQDMQLATRQAGELTARLGTLVRRTETDALERIDVADLCQEVVALLRRILPKSIVVESTIERELWIDGSRARLHQLLMNPCINARDAMPDGGVLRLDARAATIEEVASRSELAEGPHVLITVSDTGVGIPEDVVSQVFNPFFTTKGAGAGTGLGLATVARVAKEHGGAVQLSSRSGAGTALQVLLPASARAQAAIRPRPVTSDEGDAVARRDHRWHVLLVDDESAVVRAITRVLRREGHAVTQAFDGREGLERFRFVRPDVVVLDIDMPEMNGVACFEQMRGLDPAVPIIFISGHADPDREHRLLAAGARAFIRKPLDLTLLSRAIRESLPGVSRRPAAARDGAGSSAH